MSTLCAVRTSYGLAQLIAPGLVTGVFRLPPDRPALPVTRLLGARHLIQGAVSAPRPTVAVLALGIEVDLLHSLSMIGVAVADRRHRRAALTSAAVAGAFAAAGGLATSQARHQPPPAEASGALGLRDRWSERLARYLLPRRARAASYRSLASSC